MTFNKQLPFQVFEIVSYNNDQVQLINIDSKQFEHLHYVPESRENLITSAKTQKKYTKTHGALACLVVSLHQYNN